jgi:hypothetical protein
MKRKNFIKLTALLVSVFFTSQVNSQTTINTTNSNKEYKFESSINSSDLTQEEKTAYFINLCKEVENTYQVIVSDPRLKIALTTDVCEIVKRERKKSETVFYPMDKFVTIKIYSLDELKNINKTLPLIIYNK